MTRARLVGAGLPAPFERDPRNPLDRRARGVPVDADRDGERGDDADPGEGDADVVPDDPGVDDVPVDEVDG